MPSALLLAAFGPHNVKSIGEYVSNFDFSKIDVGNAESYLHLDLAPSFGSLNKESIKAMDKELKVMVAGTMRALKAHRQRNGAMDWQTVNSLFMQNAMLEPIDNEIIRSDKLIKKNSNFFKFYGSPERSVVEEVNTWFVNFIRDEDVLNSTKIDIKAMGEIVARTGAAVVSFETLFYARESHDKTLIDIGVLRFPDTSNPHFKVYRIKLVAWSESERLLGKSHNSNGIIGEYSSRRFRPRREVLNKMSENVITKAVKEAESLFDDD